MWVPVTIVFALAALTVLVVSLPAGLAGRFLPAAVRAEDFSGTVWHGSAARVAINGRPIGALEWRLHPSGLLQAHIDADLHWVQHGFVMDGVVAAQRTRLAVSDLHGVGRLEDLTDLGLPVGWRGSAVVRVREASARWTGATATLESAVGDISVDNVSAAQLAEGADLGGYTLHFANRGLNAASEATALLADNGGPLALQATIRLSLAERRGTLSGTLQARAEAPPALQRLVDDLAQVHARDPQGRLPVDVEFTL